MSISLTDKCVWNILTSNQNILDTSCEKIKYLLLQYGTGLACNRFDVGNSIEFIVKDILDSVGLDVIEQPNAKRIDMEIGGYGGLSIKYSSSANITLHNSNSSINKDNVMTDLLLLTPTHLYLITKKALLEHGIEINVYLKNTGDSLKMKRTLLTKLKQTNYPFIKPFNIEIDKTQRVNKLTSKVFYRVFNEEFKSYQATMALYKLGSEHNVQSS